MRYYLIAGEASGDLHGSNLITRIHQLDPEADIRCWGGDRMQRAGAVLVKHYRDLAFMGFVEILANLRTIMGNLSFCKKDVQAYKPDVVVLIDYPGFNMRIAGWAHEMGYKVVYYISPQVWAWKESRVKAIRKSVDRMLVILPFEKAFYARWGYEVEYVGHPLIEVVSQARKRGPGPPLAPGKIIALLPGSRRQEVSEKLPVMLRMTTFFPDYTFVLGRGPHLDDGMLADLLRDYPEVHVVEGKTYELLQQADAALVTSGTATLETALFSVPQVVCYIGNPISYQLARRLIKVKYISLVNLIMDREVVTELIQHEMNPENLRRELERILSGETRRKMQTDYQALWNILDEGDASLRAAESIVSFLNGADT